MKLILVIGSTFLASFGLLTVFDEWLEHAKRPRRWAVVDRQRRSFITMSFSAVIGVIGGTYSWYDSRRQGRVRALLFDLEVLLAQLDGLVSSALVQGNVRTSLGPIHVLVDLIGKYGFKAANILSALEKLLSENEYRSLRDGAMAITLALDELEMPEAPDTGPAVTSTLVSMQSGIRLARSHVRQLINERILQ